MTEISELIQIFDDDIDMYLQECKELNGYDDISKISQSQWNYVLSYIGKRAFYNNPSLKGNSNTCGYNTDVILSICNIYIELCYQYDKEVSIIGFTRFTGLSEEIIYQWGKNNNTYRDGSKKLSHKNFEIYQKLTKAHEESLSNKLVSNGKSNTIGVIAALNHRFGWSSPYTQTAAKDDKPRLSRQELQELPDTSAGGTPQLPG